ncbi:MAG: response regulator transcription factor [Gaiellales bacterium]
MATVVIIEDDPSVQEVLAAYLKRDGHQVHVAGDAATGQQIAERTHPALIVLDVGLPDGSGIDLCRRLRERSDVAVLMLTARSTEDDVVDGLAAGADDYVTKPFSPRVLVARVNAMLRRAGAPDAPLTSAVKVGDGALQIDTVHCVVSFREQAVDLTAAQLRLLLALARYPGRVYSREELIEAVAGSMYGRDDARVIDAHIKNLRRRLEPDPRKPRYIETVHGMGYRLATREIT